MPDEEPRTVEAESVESETPAAEVNAERARSATATARVASLEVIVSHVLRWGVVLSFVVVLVGVVLLFVEGGRSVQVRLSGTAVPVDPGAVLVGAAQLHPTSIILLGLMLLIATPIMRVAVSVIGFLFEEDFVYTVVTLFVLAMLLLSLFLGRAEG